MSKVFTFSKKKKVSAPTVDLNSFINLYQTFHVYSSYAIIKQIQYMYNHTINKLQLIIYIEW